MKFKFTIPDALLLTVTFFWGWSFVVVKWWMTAIDSFFVCTRFAFAFAED